MRPERPARRASPPVGPDEPARVTFTDAPTGRAVAVGVGVVGLVTTGMVTLMTLPPAAMAAAFVAVPLGAYGLLRVARGVFALRREVTVTADDEGLTIVHPAAAWGGEVRRGVPWAELPVPALVATDPLGVEGMELRLPDGESLFVPVGMDARAFARFAATVSVHWPGGEAALREHSLRVTGARLRGAAWKRAVEASVAALVLLGLAVATGSVWAGIPAAAGLVVAGALIRDLLRTLRGEHDLQPAFPDRPGAPSLPPG